MEAQIKVLFRMPEVRLQAKKHYWYSKRIMNHQHTCINKKNVHECETTFNFILRGVLSPPSPHKSHIIRKRKRKNSKNVHISATNILLQEKSIPYIFIHKCRNPGIGIHAHIPVQFSYRTEYLGQQPVFSFR